MPVIFQKWITREDLRRNPSVLYVFGDNIARRGYGGQAKHMRGEPNAVGVPSKYSPHSYFVDAPASVVAQNRAIDIAMQPLFAYVAAGGIVVWPADGIGTGLAELKLNSPQTFDHLKRKLEALIEASHAFDPLAS